MVPPGDDDDNGPVEFDMSDWDDDSLETVTWMLTGRQIPQEWPRPGILVVPAARADEAEGFIDYVSANPGAGTDPPEEEWRAAAAGAADAVQLSVEDFYDGDPAWQDSSEVEYGSDWTDTGAVQCEVCWVEDTGELYIVRSPPGEPMQVEIVAVIPDRAEVDRLLDGWEQAMWEPNSVEWVRKRMRRVLPPSAAATPVPGASNAADTPDESDDLAALDASLAEEEPWWEPPAEIGWITPDLYELRAAYARGRAQMDPDDALGHALKALDPGTHQRLEEFFDGHMDVVYGDGEGERIRKECRDALEREYQA